MAATKVEFATRVLLPTFFLLFNVIYWISVVV